MNRTAAFQTLGCRANQSDSDSLEMRLRARGFRIVPFEERADCYVINTCTVTDAADRTARYWIRRAHRQNPQAKIIITGCYAQMNPEELKQMEGVTYVAGNTEKEKIADRIALSWGGIRQRRTMKPFPTVSFGDGFAPLGLAMTKRRSRAYVKIQDGCNFRCSFCIIPFARGASRSRPIPEIVAEMKMLGAGGYNEIILTGIHIGSYGRDLAPRQTLMDLLLELDRQKPVRQVRISTLDPDEISEAMIDLIAGSGLFLPHLHTAIQSGDDAILRKMRRRHTTEALLKTVGYASKKISDLGFGADIIAGFPSETGAQHAATKKLLDNLPLTYLHVFPYSERRGTAAADYAEAVPVSDRRERAKELIAIGEKKRQVFWASQIGKTRRVIFEADRKGTTDNFIPLALPDSTAPKGSAGFALLEEIVKGGVLGRCSSQTMKKSA